MSDSDLDGVFRAEAAEGLERLVAGLIALEELPEGEGRAEQIRQVFRVAHTLKGAASSAGRDDFATVAHELESALDGVRRGTRVPDAELVDASLAAVDLLKAALQRTLTPREVEATTAALRAAGSAQSAPPQGAPGESEKERGKPPEAASASSRRDGGDGPADGPSGAAAATGASSSAAAAGGTAAVEAMNAIAEAMRLQTAAARVSAAERLRIAAEQAAARESSAAGRLARALLQVARALRDEDLTEKQASALLLALDVLHTDTFADASEDEVRAAEHILAEALPLHPGALRTEEAHAEPARDQGSTSDTALRVPVRTLDRVLFWMDELVATRLRVDHQRRQLEEAQDELDLALSRLALAGAQGPLQTIRRKLERVRTALVEEVHQLGTTVQRVQDEVRDVRMLPVGPTLEPYRRVVRDLARQLHKQATLELSGGDVRVDRRVHDVLKDALTHLIRNALDHGLETPEERRANGKPERGTLRLSAESRDSQLWLTLEDDGRGVDLDRVRTTAVERKLIDAARARSLSDKEVLELIFLPGFSTARAVTETSGRGVGLDVVREQVATLGGRIEVDTWAGRGTRFSLALPLTVTSTRGLIVSAGLDRYCLPLAVVQEVVTVQPHEISVASGRLVLLFRGQPISYARLSDMLSGAPGSAPERRSWAAILAVSERRIALGIDEVHGEEELVVKGLAPGSPKLAFVAGASSLSDGSLLALLEPSEIVQAISGIQLKSAEARARALPLVLVADDSLTTRTMVANVLERAGYRVLTAPDGAAALQLLLRERPALLVSDVEMPGLTGFELVARLRATEGLEHTPAILVTSLGSEEDRARGAAAGASGYVVKKDFDPSGFLSLVSELLRGRA